MHPAASRLLVRGGWAIALLAGCTRPDLALVVPGFEGTAAATWPGVVVLPNTDDDNQDSDPDWTDLAVRLGGDQVWEDDLYPVEIPEAAWERLPRGHTLHLILDGEASEVRLWRGNAVVLGDAGADEAVREWTFAPPEGPLELQVEVARAHVQAAVRLVERNRKGEQVRATFVRVFGAPMFLTHHLQPAKDVYVVSVDEGGWSNASMVERYQDVLGERLHVIDGRDYGYDVWVQDEFEFATESNPRLTRDIVIDSIRDRELDDFAEDYLQERDIEVRVFGDGGANSLDSFGNLETSPPVVVNGRSYPFGRTYWGGAADYHPTEELTDTLREAGVQEPFVTDTSWLTVGHVDEFVSFLPDPNSPKGFRMLLADVPLGWQLLESMEPSTPLPRYEDHNYSTVGALLGDEALRAHNEDIQQDRVDRIADQFMAELGLTDDDILRIPALWEELPADWGGGSAALIPGMVNLVVVQPLAGNAGPVDVFLADPFMRSDVGDQDSDPVIAWMRAAVPTGIELHFVDDWATYHLGLGEVHCGTNNTREPPPRWWDVVDEVLEPSE